MNRGVVGRLIAREPGSPVFGLWHWLVQVFDTAFADAMCHVFLKKGIVFTEFILAKAGVERRSLRYKALVGSSELLCMMAYCNFDTIKFYVRHVLRTRDLGKWI